VVEYTPDKRKVSSSNLLGFIYKRNHFFINFTKLIRIFNSLMVKRMAVNHTIVGSNPTWRVFMKCKYRLMVDFLPSKQKVWVQIPLFAIVFSF